MQWLQRGHLPDNNSSFPCLRIDAEMKVLSANDAALAAGVRVGVRLPLKEETEYRRHYAYWHNEAGTPLLSFGKTQSFACYHLRRFCGVHYVYVEYAYLFGRCTAIAVMFRDRESLDNFMDIHIESFPKYREYLSSCLKDIVPDDVSVQPNVLTAAALLQETLLFPRRGTAEATDFAALTHQYCAAIRTEGTHVSYSCSAPESFRMMELRPEAYLLLVGATIRLLEELSEDRRLNLVLTDLGDGVSIAFSGASRRIPPFLGHMADLYALTGVLPNRYSLVSLIEFLRRMARMEMTMCADHANGTFTFTFLYSSEFEEPNFKSPGCPEENFRRATAAVRLCLSLLDTEEEQ